LRMVKYSPKKIHFSRRMGFVFEYDVEFLCLVAVEFDKSNLEP
jgi:hypothetical protein